MKRWPLIRHIRYYIGLYRVNRHYNMWLGLGSLPVNANHDYAVLNRIWRGDL
jgi:hypothetical protein